MTSAHGRFRQHRALLLLLTVVFSTVGYMLLRFNGMSAGNDVSHFARWAVMIKLTGSLTGFAAYPNGFGYQTVVSLLSSFTGITVPRLQMYVMPIFLIFPILAAYITFREILGERQGLFAALLVLIHPFFLFSAFRSTHEKFTYGIIFLLLYCLYISFTSRDSATKTRFIVVGHAITLGLIFLNVFFASGFITAIATTLAAAIVLSWYYEQRLQLRRLGYSVVIWSAMLMIVSFFLYPPAAKFLNSLGDIVTQVTYLILGNAPSGTATAGGGSPYNSLIFKWDSFEVYLILISYYFVVYPVAGLYWLARAPTFLSERSLDEDQISEMFILALFASFGLQFAFAIVSDQTGLLGANTQLRIFPLLGFMAIILTTRVVFRILNNRTASPSTNKIWSGQLGSIRANLVPILLVALLVMFSITGIVKATNEPAVSTGWYLTNDEEQTATDWLETNVVYGYFWVGYTPRLRYDQRLRHPSQRRNDQLLRHSQRGVNNRYDPGTINTVVEHIIISDIIRKHAEVGGFPLPPRDGASRIYTNGGTEIYWFERVRAMESYNEAFRRSQSR